MIIEATYIGRNGSLGLLTGEVYNIKTYVVDGYIWVKLLGTRLEHVPYTQLETFLESWVILGDNIKGRV